MGIIWNRQWKKCFWVNAFGTVFDKFSRKGFKISSGIFHTLKNESVRGPCGGCLIIEVSAPRVNILGYMNAGLLGLN